ncbi:Na+/H+ antiporter NhaC family protein [Clostridium phoceensis]|uniref:Na+/H+ antiporter NhaC family protein n=1 Tax=Clostridium phoceensis TaxID=1650661 RepID=UPI0023F2EFCA|nr:Na+/H+ antiporter NhaC family protein [Clostridium phoceensis]
MELLVFSLFAAALLVCVIFHISLLFALLLGYVIFALYAIRKGFSLPEVLGMSAQGVRAAKNILTTFVLIGILTSLWRAGGTIPAIVCYSVRVMEPRLFLVCSFLLNCLVSFLTGTAFGSAATMGAVCMTMAAALGADPLMTGGAILSGVYFGDRCSPVSTSALLVADLTGTDLFGNIRQMLRTSLVPFALAAGLYLLFGLSSPAAGQAADIAPLFALEFRLGPLPLIPAALILVLSALRVRVKAAMLASIAAAAVLCLAYQGAAPLTLLKDAVLGFSAQSPELATMIDGGGIVSMLQVGAIVCLSSSYSGIFQRTGLLEPIRRRIEAWGAVLSPYAAVLVTSVLASAIACNQTLSIMLTHQLCGGLEKSREKLAIYLENSAVVVAPLIPWSIAGGVPLASAGAPAASLLTAFFLFLLPLWQLVTAGRGRRATV